MPTTVSLLGSTGSIGKNTLQVLKEHPQHFCLKGIAVNSSWQKACQQAEEFTVPLVCIYEYNAYLLAKKTYPSLRLVTGIEGLIEVATCADRVVQAMSGTKGLLPTLKALESGKLVAFANKEVLVAGGELVLEQAKKGGGILLPVDSEHSAIFQCLVGETIESVERLILTASGGPFATTPKSELETITPKQALCHPTWSMGPKISIDSSTLMNKGLEVIEASLLFSLPPEKIEVILHKESLIHSFVEFVDRSMKAQLSAPTMTIPIQYALTYPKRLASKREKFSFEKFSSMHFSEVDRKKFKCLDLAYAALREGGSLLPFLNRCNEVLVKRFLEGEIGWLDIANKLESLMERHSVSKITSFVMLEALDEEASRLAQEH